MWKLSESELREFGIHGYIGGNYASERVRRAVYFRLRRVGHQQRWRECLCDEQLEYDPVRAALDRETA